MVKYMPILAGYNFDKFNDHVACGQSLSRPHSSIFFCGLFGTLNWVHHATALYFQAIYLSTVISHCSTCRRIDAVNASMSLCQCSMLLFEKTVWHFLENFAHIAKVFELKHKKFIDSSPIRYIYHSKI